MFVKIEEKKKCEINNLARKIKKVIVLISCCMDPNLSYSKKVIVKLFILDVKIRKKKKKLY